jgi:P2-related tail formation protein
MAFTTLDRLSLTQLLSPALANDPTAWAMAQALDAELQALTATIPQSLLVDFSRQSDAALDYIATERRVWGYNVAFDRDFKIQLINNSLYWNSHKGTPGLIEAAITAIFNHVKVVPWFASGNLPYTFQVSCDQPPSGQQLKDMNLAVSQLQSVRDWFDGFALHYNITAPVFVGISEFTVTDGYIGAIPRGFPGFSSPPPGTSQ